MCVYIYIALRKRAETQKKGGVVLEKPFCSPFIPSREPEAKLTRHKNTQLLSISSPLCIIYPPGF